MDIARRDHQPRHRARSPSARARDAEVVKRLRDAGAIVIGKTKMPELGLWPFTESITWGVTRNPWDTDRTPGGSSGGSAAAVAAGLVPAAVAADGAGLDPHPRRLLRAVRPQAAQRAASRGRRTRRRTPLDLLRRPDALGAGRRLMYDVLAPGHRARRRGGR